MNLLKINKLCQSEKKNKFFFRKNLHRKFLCVYLCRAFETNEFLKVQNAEVAQLVEHDLAKVGVASSSLVFRSKASLR